MSIEDLQNITIITSHTCCVNNTNIGIKLKLSHWIFYNLIDTWLG